MHIQAKQDGAVTFRVNARESRAMAATLHLAKIVAKFHGPESAAANSVVTHLERLQETLAGRGDNDATPCAVIDDEVN